MKEILLIAPYESMAELAASLVREKDYDNVEILRGDLREGVAAAHRAVEEGTRVLISRGGTFTMIRDEVEAPVVEIQVSAYDVLSNIQHVIGRDEPLAIVGHNNLIYGYDLLKTTMKNVTQVNLERGESVEDRIADCVRKGITNFMGDAVVKRVCGEMGYPCFILESGADSIDAAIQEARRILAAADREMERAKRYMAVIDYVHDGVIATDDQNRIQVFNSMAQRITGQLREDIIGKTVEELSGLDEVLREITAGKRVVDEVRSIGDTKIAMSTIPIQVNREDRGAVAVFQDVTSLQSLEQRVRFKLVDKGFVARHTFDSIRYASERMERCISLARKFSAYDSGVLIQGNSGVGKELFAQSIHNESRRKKGPFVAINCAALPGTLIESELFGYAEGAFTGSRRGGKAGVFELAHTGTIFLDEISELPIDMQGRLLRVIQEREVMRVGDDKVIPLDVRIVCATNRNLKEMVKEGAFRRDLLYRINTLAFVIPPLSQRPEDMEVLAPHFLERYCRKYSKQIRGFSGSAMNYLKAYEYEGNVRELQGMVERAVIICESDRIRVQDLSDGREDENQTAVPTAGGVRFAEATEMAAGQPVLTSLTSLLGQTDPLALNELPALVELPPLADLEDQYIREVYRRCGGSVKKACEILKINRTTLWRKLKQ